jgi:hypothetical protein
VWTERVAWVGSAASLLLPGTPQTRVGAWVGSAASLLLPGTPQTRVGAWVTRASTMALMNVRRHNSLHLTSSICRS